MYQIKKFTRIKFKSSKRRKRKSCTLSSTSIRSCTSIRRSFCVDGALDGAVDDPRNSNCSETTSFRLTSSSYLRGSPNSTRRPETSYGCVVFVACVQYVHLI